jgi:hypothetical protein
MSTKLNTIVLPSVSGHENYTLQYLTAPGETNGLLLTLNVQTHEYHTLTKSVGIKVLIHDQDEKIFIREGGFAVMPGRKALVSVTKTQVISQWLKILGSILGYSPFCVIIHIQYRTRFIREGYLLFHLPHG